MIARRAVPAVVNALIRTANQAGHTRQNRALFLVVISFFIGDLFCNSRAARAQDLAENAGETPIPAGRAVPGIGTGRPPRAVNCTRPPPAASGTTIGPASYATVGNYPSPTVDDASPNILASDVVDNEAAANQPAQDQSQQTVPATPPSSTKKRAVYGAKERSAEMEANRFAINPITGLSSASTMNFCPLTAHERWKMYWTKNYASLGAYTGPVLGAVLIDQPADSPHAWGRHASGFGLRVANRVGIGMMEGTVQAPLAAVMHYDVRYISSSAELRKKRLWHAILFSFVTFNSEAQVVPNIPKFAGFYAGTALSTTWLPGRRDVGKYTLIDGTESIGLTVPVNILQEFWPDIKHGIFHRNKE